ncbi:MAG: M14 family zinc carboxypeptidase, partial [Pyrinomonadaceae bacterium]
HTNYAGLERWLAALGRGSNRVRVVRYGASLEHHPLYLIIISSPENLARLDVVRDGMRKLSDPRVTTEAEAAQIATTLPAVAWMNHANDGNESAAFESAIQTSYQLAAGTDETTRLVLDRLVTIVNPAHNPESHERFVAWYNSVQITKQGSSDPASSEHHAPWGLDTNNNHYQIDLNRDAFFITQHETAALVRAFNEWNPILFVDHHGQTKNRFFPPPAEAINLNFTETQLDWMNGYGAAVGAAFDRRGWSYYRRGRFDLFYAGFWDSWPTLNGSVGLTFETDGGGAKGLAHEREDKTILTLRDGVVHHHTGTMATLKLTAENKEGRLRDFYNFKKTAIDEGAREPLRQIILVPAGDASRAEKLVETLRAQRIETYRTAAPLRLARAHSYLGGGVAPQNIPAGAYIVPMAQPQTRLARAILEVEPTFKEEFLRNEERKKKRADLIGTRPRDGFYDTTAWSLPILYGVEAYWAEDAFNQSAATLVAESSSNQAASAPPRASYAYVFGPESLGSMRLVAQLMKENFNTAVATAPFRVAGRDYPRGSIIARVDRNAAALHERIVALAQAAGVALAPLNSARTDGGPDFGEDPFVELSVPPRIAVVTDEPTDARSYGAAWFTLEERLGVGFSALKIEQLKTVNLSRYDCIVFPHGAPAAYHEMLGETGVARLKRWADDGGTLVLIKGAAAMATRKGVEWTGATLKKQKANVRLFFEESETGTPPAAAASTAAASTAANAGPKPEAEPSEAGETRETELIRTPGALLRVRIDPEHFLGFGYSADVGATVSSNYAFTISARGANVAAYPDEATLRLAGFMWPEAKKALAKTLYLWHEPAGRGQIILFADDPNFRAAQLSTMRLFFNAVILAPSFSR